MKTVLRRLDDRERRVADENFGLVISTARQFRLPRSITFSELVSAGSLGLIRAVITHDANRGRFADHAFWKIRSAIRRFMSDRIRDLDRQRSVVSLRDDLHILRHEDWFDHSEIRDLVSSMGERDQEIVFMRFGLADMSFQVIGQHVDLSAEGVRKRVNRMGLLMET